MNISIDITPNRFTRMLGGVAEKVTRQRIALQKKANVKYCKVLARFEKK